MTLEARSLSVPDSPQPSLLFILTDQQRSDSLGCYGNRFVRTPNLDELAGSGSVFEAAYVTQPVCTPSRASILTGLYPHAHGCINNNDPLPADIRTLAECVPDGYRRAYMGKWHLGDELRPQHGFDEWVTIEDGYSEYFSDALSKSERSDYHRYLSDLGVQPAGEDATFTREQAARLPAEHTKASFLAREATRFLDSVGMQPFVLFLSFLEPHRPYFGPYDDMYPPEEVPVGPTFRTRPSENAARINRLMAEHYMRGGEIDGCDLTTEAGSRELRARYLGNVTLVDEAVGQVLRALDRSGQADRTVVVYTSEHGDMLGDHGIFEKCVMYEEAIRVPLIVRVPWLRPQRIPGPVSQIDLVPTLLDLLHAEPPLKLQGRSLRGVLAGEETLAANDVVVEWNGTEWRPARPFARGLPPEVFDESVQGPWRTLISPDGWKINVNLRDQCELHDLGADPHERVNRFDDPSQANRVRDLIGRLRMWQARTDDVVPLSEDPGGQQ